MKFGKEPPYLICEIANVHGGDINHLYRVVDAFKGASYGKKGIKFQVFDPDKIALSDFSWYPVYKELYFTQVEWRNIIRHANDGGDVWIDLFDLYGVEVLKKNLSFVAGIKLQASVIGNYEVFNALSDLDLSDITIIINVSALDLNEIERAINKFRALSSSIVLQIGFQTYPTAIEDTGLNKIPVLRSAFPDIPLCMADHADATTEFALRAPVYAFMMGASYIEKHFCLSREESKYDSFSAIEPPQLEGMCTALTEANRARVAPFVSESEKEYLLKTKQVPVLSSGLGAGDLVAESDLIYRRTAQSGLATDEIKALQRKGKVLSRNTKGLTTIDADSYRNANLAVVVAGRMKSTRLPKKALLPIAGSTSVERCLRQCLGVNQVDHVILATSNLESDDPLAEYTLGGRVTVWRGDPDDVIARYLTACDAYNLDIIVRVTADCPLVLPDIVETLLCSHFESGADYTAAKEFAVGSSAEIISVNALRKVADYFGRAEYSEYMTWYFQNNADFFKINIIDLPLKMVRDYRLTLDYQEDLDMFQKLYSVLGDAKEPFRSEEVFKVLDSDPGISATNKNLPLRYKTDAKLIETLNRETKM